MKSIFKLTKRDSHQLEIASKYLPTTKRIFDSLGRALLPLVENTYAYPSSFSEAKKRRLQQSNGAMYHQIASHRFFIKENEANYYASMETDRDKFEEENMFKIERRKVVEEMEVRRRLSQERERIKRDEEAQALERRARLEMLTADQLMESVKLQKREAEEKGNRTKRQSKMLKAKMDEEAGNNLHNFKIGTDDLETTLQFQDTPLFPHEPKSNPQRKAKVKGKKEGEGQGLAGERKRLKKKVLNPRDISSDEMLDVADDDDVIFDEDPLQQSAQKPDKKVKLDPVGRANNDDSDLDDNLPDQDDIQIANVDFGGKDGDENTF